MGQSMSDRFGRGSRCVCSFLAHSTGTPMFSSVHHPGLPGLVLEKHTGMVDRGAPQLDCIGHRVRWYLARHERSQLVLRWILVCLSAPASTAPIYAVLILSSSVVLARTSPTLAYPSFSRGCRAIRCQVSNVIYLYAPYPLGSCVARCVLLTPIFFRRLPRMVMSCC